MTNPDSMTYGGHPNAPDLRWQAARSFYLTAKAQLVLAGKPHGMRAIAVIVRCVNFPQYTTPNGTMRSWGMVCRWVTDWNAQASTLGVAPMTLTLGPGWAKVATAEEPWPEYDDAGNPSKHHMRLYYNTD